MTINKLADPEEYWSTQFKSVEGKYHQLLNMFRQKNIDPSYSSNYYSWAYTTFLNNFNVKNKNVLDQGTCRSIFPHIARQKGASIQTIDTAWLEERMEMNRIIGHKIPHNLGDMREMIMYPNNYFDFVTNMFAFCVVGSQEDYSGHVEFDILKEAHRVLKKGGIYFIVTDYAKDKSKLDLNRKSGKIYNEDEINSLIIEPAKEIGFKLYDEVDFTEKQYTVGGYTFLILCFKK